MSGEYPTKEIIDQWKEKFGGVPILSFDEFDDGESYFIRAISSAEFEAFWEEVVTRTGTADEKVSESIQEDILMRECVLWPVNFYDRYKNDQLLFGIVDHLKENIQGISGFFEMYPMRLDNYIQTVELSTERDALVKELKEFTLKLAPKQDDDGNLLNLDVEPDVINRINTIEDRIRILESMTLFDLDEVTYRPTIEQLNTWKEEFPGKPIFVLMFMSTHYVFRACTQRELKDALAAEKYSSNETETMNRAMLRNFVLYPNNFIERMDTKYMLPANIPLLINDGLRKASGWREITPKFHNR